MCPLIWEFLLWLGLVVPREGSTARRLRFRQTIIPHPRFGVCCVVGRLCWSAFIVAARGRGLVSSALRWPNSWQLPPLRPPWEWWRRQIGLAKCKAMSLFVWQQWHMPALCACRAKLRVLLLVCLLLVGLTVVGPQGYIFLSVAFRNDSCTAVCLCLFRMCVCLGVLRGCVLISCCVTKIELWCPILPLSGFCACMLVSMAGLHLQAPLFLFSILCWTLSSAFYIERIRFSCAKLSIALRKGGVKLIKYGHFDVVCLESNCQKIWFLPFATMLPGSHEQQV